MTKQILNILKKLISFKSITPKSNGSIEYIANLLNEAGFACDIQIFGKKEEVTHNLYAKFGNGSPNICFAGHVDVVPPMQEELWNFNPFELTICEDVIYGRGMVDMKGAIATSITAAINYINTNKTFKGSISFLLTSDEEGGAKYGTKAMLEYLTQKDEKIDFTILGEPTYERQIGDTIKIGRRGSINFNLIVHGVQGHVAYPERCANPISSLVKIASDLMKIDFDTEIISVSDLSETKKLSKQRQYYNKTNLEITSIDVGNNVTNIIPETAKMKFNIRFNNLHPYNFISALIMEKIARHEVMFDLKYHASAEPFEQEYSSRMRQFARIVKKEAGIIPNISMGGGTSDARFIHKYSPVVEFGLHSHLAHKINEYTKISDLQILYNVYYTSLTEFFKE